MSSLGPSAAAMGGPPQGGGQGPPVTMYTSAAIQALHDAIAHEPDPADKAVLSQCLQNVLKIQAKNMQQAQAGGPGQALGAQLGG